jgi:7-keto-8-aminopelargonate synthetase-like enzyme
MSSKDWFDLDLSAEQTYGFNPYFNLVEGALNSPVLIGGREMFDLASNNYLGFASHPQIIEAQKQALDKFGSSLCGTPIASGTTALSRQTEEELSHWLGLEDGMFFPSCYQLNMGIFPLLAGKNDLIVFDHFCHSSLLEGMRASGAKLKPFLHNNTDHLERQLQKTEAYNRVLVVTESVFSTEGSIAPLPAILKLCRKYEAFPVIDDSHGIGVLGETGRGVLEHFSISDFEGIYTASTGKALANGGGYLGGSAEIIQYLRYRCPAYLYSTALSPASFGGISAAIALLKEQSPRLLGQLRRNTERLKNSLGGADIVAAEAPIVSLAAGSFERAVTFSKKFFEAGIFVTPFIPPSVPENQCKVRLIAGAGLDDAQMTTVCERIGELSWL